MVFRGEVGLAFEIGPLSRLEGWWCVEVFVRFYLQIRFSGVVSASPIMYMSGSGCGSPRLSFVTWRVKPFHLFPWELRRFSLARDRA